MLTLRRQFGFNLIEGMVALAVLGILIAAALPSVSDWMRLTQVRNIAETTVNGLQKTRVEAMKRNRVMTFWLVSPADTASPGSNCTLSSSSGAWVISVDNPTGSCDEDPSPTDAPRLVERYGPGPAGAQISVTAAATTPTGTVTASSVSFNGYGQVERTGTWISRIDVRHSASDTARRLRVEVSNSGAVRMCDMDVTDATDLRACRQEPLP